MVRDTLVLTVDKLFSTMASKVTQYKEDISSCRDLRDVAMATKFLWQKIGTNLTKVAISSVVCDISMQSLVLR